MQVNQPTFIRREQDGQTALVRPEGASAIAAALFDGEGCTSLEISGRARVFCFTWKDGHEGILRHCRRGGLVRWMLQDSYLFHNRPLREFRAHEEALLRGIPAPELLGVVWRCRWGIYSGALATGRLEGLDLDGWLCAHLDTGRRVEEMLRASGVLVRQAHDAGLYHADLNIKNIFIAAEKPALLDFDRARFSSSLGPVDRARNLLRLRRSFERKGYSRSHFNALLDGYGDFTMPRWLEQTYRLKGLFSDTIHWKGREPEP